MKEAMLYEKGEYGFVLCNLCHHHCKIKEGGRGICAVRENQDGILVSLVYGKAIATHIDPIEKKPLFHFQPGSFSFSIATVGCNFSCKFCQNYSISQMPRDHKRIQGEDLPPEEAISIAEQYQCKSISYTYTEPTIFFEYAYDIARLAKEKGMKNVFVSNGYMTPEAVEVIAPYLDGINIDLKAMKPETYREYFGAKLQGVQETLKCLVSKGIWVEITTLIVPTVNDDEGQLRAAAEFIYSLDPSIPWHLSRFHPDYKFLSVPPTPLKTIKKAEEIAKQIGLKYVYTGNVFGDEGENTFCPHCGEKIIVRYGFSVMDNLIKDSKCSQCGEKIEGVWL